MGTVMSKEKTKRNSSIELLRIVAMLIIITHHFGMHGIFHVLDKSKNILSVDALNWQMIFTQLVCWGGGLGNILFMMITGYFMINRSVNVKKIILLVFSLFLYSWIIEIIAFGAFKLPHSISDIISQTIPIYFGHNWFVSCYIIFSMFIPFVNELLNSLSKRKYLTLLLLLFVCQAVIPTLRGVTFMSGSPFIFFGFGYAIGGYLKRHFQNNIKVEYNKKYAKMFFIIFIILELSILSLDGLGIYLHSDRFVQLAGNMFGASIFYAPLAISLFLFFLTLEPFYNSRVNKMAGSVLGIYLIHDNDLMRTILWDYIVPNIEYINNNYYIVFYILKVIAVFVICCFVDYWRKNYIEPIISKILDIHWKSIEFSFTQKAEWIISKLGR